MPDNALFLPNQTGDGTMPLCPRCKWKVPDGQIGEAKNYPEDGAVAVFFECPNCKDEFQAIATYPVKKEG